MTTFQNIDMYCDACDTEFSIKLQNATNSEYEEERPTVEFCPFCGEVILEDEESGLDDESEDLLQ